MYSILARDWYQPDTVSAVLGEEDQSNHIEYFQGYSQFYERGLPSELPAEIKESISEKSEIAEIRARIERFKQSHDGESLKSERLESFGLGMSQVSDCRQLQLGGMKRDAFYLYALTTIGRIEEIKDYQDQGAWHVKYALPRYD